MLQHEHRQTITQRIDPKIILANTILQLNNMELMQSIENELLENPALEAVEDHGCAGGCVAPGLCPNCNAPAEAVVRADNLTFLARDVEFDGSSVPDLYPPDEDYDLVGNLEAEITFAEHLRSQLRAALPPSDYRIGEYLISSLDERGWLSECPDSIAEELGVDETEVQRILRVVQSLDPPGVGARTLQECLLLQLKYLSEEGHSQSDSSILKIAEQLVGEHFDSFWKRRYPRLARAVRCTIEEAKEASDFVSRYLNPFPASQFRPPHTASPTNSRAVVRPDVVIRRTELGYDIEVVGAESHMLSVNSHYRDAYIRMKADKRSQNEQDRKHIAEYVERAERFINNIRLRRQTLRQITRCIVDQQTGFLETGSPQFLRPLTRTRIARTLGIHESTVSRATANKYVQLPNQEVIPYMLFFDASLSIKNAIEGIIHHEDSSNPLSDQQIVEALGAQGIQVARRTVVKYREQQKILSSTRRRR